MFGRSDSQPTHFDTLIGKSARVQGDLQFRGGLHIDGSIGGNVIATPDSAATLSVSEHGQIDGSIDAPQVVLNGRVTGDIVATERLVLGAKARVQGNVHYGAI
jgi:cytoskeletal protein CcmA (bactofilin family)